MDYDRNDALLHWLFRQTQGDAWFRPNEEHISSGVALRINDSPEFRVFPYENSSLEPFEVAVSGLNPVVAIKVRSAAVHAALAEVAPEDKSIYVDANTRIQIIETMLLLPTAEKEQCAAFIRDERVLVVWSDSLDNIVPTCRDIEERLIRLLWRSRPGLGPNAVSVSGTGTTSLISEGGSVDSHALLPNPPSGTSDIQASVRGVTPSSLRHGQSRLSGSHTADLEKKKKSWYNRNKSPHSLSPNDVEAGYRDEKDKQALASDTSSNLAEKDIFPSGSRKIKLFAPIYNGLAAGLALYFIGNGIKTLLEEWSLDGSYLHFVLLVLLPLLFCVSLFFALQIIQNLTMAVGPIAHFHENSKYYSAVKPAANKVVDEALPHITIQMPVYKEGLASVLAPSIESIKKAMQTYARQGGTSNIFINDDGMRVVSPAIRDERISYYANHNIGWVSRPKHEDGADGYKRAGRFKKASNMNYALALSLKLEKHLQTLRSDPSHSSHSRSHRQSTAGEDYRDPSPIPSSLPNSSSTSPDYGLANSPQPPNTVASNASNHPYYGQSMREDFEEKALALAVDELYEESGRRWRPWAANARSIRVGEIILIVDSDTVVPEDCLRDAAREMRECESVAIIQHESDVLQVAHHYFENGIAYFTRRINRCISMSCANGEVAPFMGHNAFLRWRAVQDAAFIDPADGKEKIWSESNVSEDFDMALRLMMRGYIIRWATYSQGAFKEGVSLSVDDELNRWQKYAYGCSELMFNPFVQWFKKGPISHNIHRFLWSNSPFHYKISMLAYMFSYYGIAASMTISTINYFILGFQLHIDGVYMRSFEIWLATVVVFFGSGTVGYTLLEYRLGQKQLFSAFLENVMWTPFFFFFFGGLSIPVSQAMLAHLFSYNISWSATIKEVERSNFFKEIPKIAKRFWFPMTVSFAVIITMIVLSLPFVPFAFRIDASAWGVMIPLAVNAGCHILSPIVLNPWLMVFSY